jgi:hypothetical protein
MGNRSERKRKTTARELLARTRATRAQVPGSGAALSDAGLGPGVKSPTLDEHPTVPKRRLVLSKQPPSTF